MDIDCQYYPLAVTSNKVIYADEFSNKIRLVSWYDSKTRRTALRYVEGVNFLE